MEVAEKANERPVKAQWDRALTHELMEFRAAGGAEVPQRIEMIDLKRCADLIHGQVRLGIQIDDLTAALFGRGQDRLRGKKSDAAQVGIKLHKLVRPVQGIAQGIDDGIRCLLDESLIQQFTSAQLLNRAFASELASLGHPSCENRGGGTRERPKQGGRGRDH